MGTINIAGHNCTFPQISHAILNTYGVTPRTYQLAYKTPPQPACLMLVLMLQSMYQITALERPPYFVEDDKRTIVLLEHPNKQALETLERWLHWLVGNQYLIRCPYRIAKTDDDLQYSETWDALEIVKTKYGRRPMIGTHPPSRTLPKPVEMYPDDGGSALSYPPKELPQ